MLRAIDAGTKEAFFERQMPKNYTVDTLLERREKMPSLIKERLPLFQAEENVTLSRRELKKMLLEAAQRGYELGMSERDPSA